MSVESVLIALIAALSGGGGIVAALRVWQDHRRGVREADADAAGAALEGFRALVADLRAEVDRQATRIDRIEHQITVERDLRWSAIQYVRVLLGWVSQVLPGATPPSVPGDLAEHIVYPSSPPSAHEETRP